MIEPEFPRPLKLDQIGAKPHAISIEASGDERATLAVRFDLIELTKLAAELHYSRAGEDVIVTGRFEASFVQACIASGAPVAGKVAEAVSIRFIPTLAPDPDAEIELSTEDCDVIEYEGQTVDLGEAIAQSLGLALDPFPRSRDAEVILRSAGVKSEDEVTGFSGLSGLRDLLEKR